MQGQTYMKTSRSLNKYRPSAHLIASICGCALWERGRVEDQPQHVRSGNVLNKIESGRMFEQAAAGLQHSRAPKKCYRPQLGPYSAKLAGSWVRLQPILFNPLHQFRQFGFTVRFEQIRVRT